MMNSFRSMESDAADNRLVPYSAECAVDPGETGIERIVDGVSGRRCGRQPMSKAGIVEAQGVAVLADRSLAGLVEARRCGGADLDTDLDRGPVWPRGGRISCWTVEKSLAGEIGVQGHRAQ